MLLQFRVARQVLHVGYPPQSLHELDERQRGILSHALELVRHHHLAPHVDDAQLVVMQAFWGLEVAVDEAASLRQPDELLLGEVPQRVPRGEREDALELPLEARKHLHDVPGVQPILAEDVAVQTRHGRLPLEGVADEQHVPLQSEFDVLRLLELHGEPHDALQELEPEESVLVVGVVLRFLGLVGGGLQLVDLLEQRPQVHDVALRRLGSLLDVLLLAKARAVCKLLEVVEAHAGEVALVRPATEVRETVAQHVVLLAQRLLEKVPQRLVLHLAGLLLQLGQLVFFLELDEGLLLVDARPVGLEHLVAQAGHVKVVLGRRLLAPVSEDGVVQHGLHRLHHHGLRLVQRPAKDGGHLVSKRLLALLLFKQLIV
mmetsp:Transcript_4128/g.7944  ORF Transcript_4128/g.7944 Transcript_4128/m.7944 type:complete len:373 (-) Transcript_4128:460-1578(-)